MTAADPLGLAAGHGLTPAQAQNIAVHDQAAAAWLHGFLDPVAQGMRTTAVTSAVDGNGTLFHYVSTSGTRGVAGTIRNQYQTLENWYQAQGIGGVVWEASPHPIPGGASPHAEYNALEDINAFGHQPVGGGAARNVCNNCAAYLQGNGATLFGTVYAGGPNTTPHRTFHW
jgi:hypothetical protein